MQNWEYLEIAVHYHHWMDSMGRKGTFADEMTSGDGDSLSYNSAFLLNELGAQGWELTGVASQHTASFKLFLKRPRS